MRGMRRDNVRVITMSKAWQPLAPFLWRHLGHCSSCIRKAFQAATCAWTAALLLLGLDWPRFLPAIVIIALGLTALWVAHLVAYAGKATLAEKSDSSAENDNAYITTSSRRDLLPLFARALAVAALTSAAPTLALADGPCGGQCGDIQCRPCFRPVYDGQGGCNCESCHSCPGPENKYNCNGQC